MTAANAPIKPARVPPTLIHLWPLLIGLRSSCPKAHALCDRGTTAATFRRRLMRGARAPLGADGRFLEEVVALLAKLRDAYLVFQPIRRKGSVLWAEHRIGWRQRRSAMETHEDLFASIREAVHEFASTPYVRARARRQGGFSMAEIGHAIFGHGFVRSGNIAAQVARQLVEDGWEMLPVCQLRGLRVRPFMPAVDPPSDNHAQVANECKPVIDGTRRLDHGSTREDVVTEGIACGGHAPAPPKAIPPAPAPAPADVHDAISTTEPVADESCVEADCDPANPVASSPAASSLQPAFLQRLEQWAARPDVLVRGREREGFTLKEIFAEVAGSGATRSRSLEMKISTLLRRRGWEHPTLCRRNGVRTRLYVPPKA